MFPSLVLFFAILFTLFSIYMMLQLLIVFLVQFYYKATFDRDDKKAMKNDFGKSTLFDFAAAFFWAFFYYLTH